MLHDFFPGNGLYVDLDGGTLQAARIETRDKLDLVVGATYNLSFDYNRNYDSQTDEFLTFGVGGVSGALSIPAYTMRSSLLTYSMNFIASQGASSLFFDAAGGDNMGPLIDNVRLSEVAIPAPVPAALPLMLSALGALAALRRRRRA